MSYIENSRSAKWVLDVALLEKIGRSAALALFLCCSIKENFKSWIPPGLGGSPWTFNVFFVCCCHASIRLLIGQYRKRIFLESKERGSLSSTAHLRER